jgi:hypothetical protein
MTFKVLVVGLVLLGASAVIVGYALTKTSHSSRPAAAWTADYCAVVTPLKSSIAKSTDIDGLASVLEEAGKKISALAPAEGTMSYQKELSSGLIEMGAVLRSLEAQDNRRLNAMEAQSAVIEGKINRAQLALPADVQSAIAAVPNCDIKQF